jgi:glycerophosphodiester phosphodiesterase
MNVDLSYEYCDLVQAVIEELGVTDQILIMGKRVPEVVAAKFAEHPCNEWLTIGSMICNCGVFAL